MWNSKLWVGLVVTQVVSAPSNSHENESLFSWKNLVSVHAAGGRDQRRKPAAINLGAAGADAGLRGFHTQ